MVINQAADSMARSAATTTCNTSSTGIHARRGRPGQPVADHRCDRRTHDGPFRGDPLTPEVSTVSTDLPTTVADLIVEQLRQLGISTLFGGARRQRGEHLRRGASAP